MAATERDAMILGSRNHRAAGVLSGSSAAAVAAHLLHSGDPVL